MNIHERLEAFWLGEKPDRIPYTIYLNEWLAHQRDSAWDPMFRDGLGVTWHISAFKLEMRGVETITRIEERREGTFVIKVMKTPMGEISQSTRDGWQDRYFLRTKEDYRVMTDIVRRTSIAPRYDEVAAKTETIQPHGVSLLYLGRSPLQQILVDMAGLEAFSYHLADYEDEVRTLYDALLTLFRKKVEITAGCPGRFVSAFENFTSESLGPERFKEFLLPVYEECFPELHDAGKIVGCHYDGRTAGCRDLIARAPIDLIESLTEPSEGDQTLSEARSVWPDKLFWCNIRVGDYGLTPEQLRKKVLALIGEGSVEGRALAFEVSEQIPPNWRESMPVVLAALNGL